MTLADIWNFIIHVDLISVALYGFFIFLGIVIIAYLFMGYIKINEAYNSLFEKIKNPWIRILINYWIKSNNPVYYDNHRLPKIWPDKKYILDS